MSQFCPKCGTKNIDEAKFCKNCGANIAQTTSKTNESPKQASEYLSNGFAVIVLIVIIGVVIFMPTSYSRESATAEEAPIIAEETAATTEASPAKKENSSTDLKVLIKDHVANIDWADDDNYKYNDEDVVKFKNNLAEIIIYTVVNGVGGNDYEQFMIAKINDVIYRPIYIGGKGVFMADTIQFDGTEIVINGMANKEDDAWGFPTLPHTKRFSVKGSKIIEQ